MQWWQFLIVLLLGHGSGLYAGMRYRPALVTKVIAAVRAAEAAEMAATAGGGPSDGYATHDVLLGLCGRLEPAGWHCHQRQGHAGACLLTPHPQPPVKTPNGGTP